MNWVLGGWSAVSALCLVLAAIHGHVWWRLRARAAEGAFAATSLTVAVVALLELAMMHVGTPDAFCALLSLHYLALMTGTVAVVVFVRAYHGVGRRWLGGLAIAMRAGVTAAALLMEPNLHFSEVAAMETVSLMGAPVSVPVATPNPWMPMATISSLVLAAFFVDAAVTLWRQGRRRRALALTASLTLFVATSLTSGWITVWGEGRLPFMVAPFFAPVVVLVGLQLGRDLLRTARLASDLSAAQQRLVASQRRLSLAADAARAGFWSVDPATGRFWGTPSAMRMFGLPGDRTPDLDELLEAIHPDDRGKVREALSRAIVLEEFGSVEYRVPGAGGEILRHVAFGGGRHTGADGGRVLTGMTLDVTERRRAEEALVAQRRQLAHLSRVVTVGEISDALARELDQPLEVATSSAEAARALLARDAADLAGMRNALQAIVDAADRAGRVVGRLRKLLRSGVSERERLSVDALVDDVLGFLRSDLAARGIAVETAHDAASPTVEGERVAIEQVLISLMRAACSAVPADGSSERLLSVRTRPGEGGVSVRIAGPGASPSADATDVFGESPEAPDQERSGSLSVCRSIIESHGGRIRAEPDRAPGACFTFWLPAARASPGA